VSGKGQRGVSGKGEECRRKTALPVIADK
jgi:hypothetical protein